MRFVLGLLGLLASLHAPAFAQSYPNKNVTLVVPFAPGGASDIMGRAIGQKLSEAWKQPVIIDNRPGASTTLGTAYAATQPADGYTLLLGTAARSSSCRTSIPTCVIRRWRISAQSR